MITAVSKANSAAVFPEEENLSDDAWIERIRHGELGDERVRQLFEGAVTGARWALAREILSKEVCPSESVRRLGLKAVENGHVGTLAFLLGKYPARDLVLTDLLHSAVSKGRLHCAQTILENSSDLFLDPLLNFAMTCLNSADMVDLLLLREWPRHQPLQREVVEKALVAAAHSGHLYGVQALIDRRRDIGVKAVGEALVAAIRERKNEWTACCLFLIRRRKDLDVDSIVWLLTLAVGQDEACFIMEVFAEKIPDLAFLVYNDLVHEHAAAQGKLDCLQNLVSCFKQSNLIRDRPNPYEGALRCAAENGHLDCVLFLWEEMGCPSYPELARQLKVMAVRLSADDSLKFQRSPLYRLLQQEEKPPAPRRCAVS